MSTTLARALLFAAIAHRGQADFHGIPYIEHVLAVVEGVSSHGLSVMTVAALHDVVEDTDWTRFEMEKMFGRTIANSVDDLTRRKGEVYMDYVRRAGKNPVSRIVKVADLNHNLDPRRKRVGRSEDRYRKALAYLEEMA